ncbi:hypothetical protein M0R72_11470 [Candidatus Pacearchaeota archaeon]|jgi:voltage-gated potassium channel Kch|nr:hypothetical protein [Candidatus Pacearchaeota archaeon]
MATELSKLFVVIGAKTDEFTKGLDGVKTKTEGFAGQMSGVFGKLLTGAMVVTAVAGVAEMVKSTAQLGAELDNMSKRTGISVKTLQEFRYAAGVTGSSIEEFEVGLKRMQVTLNKAFEGNKNAVAAIESLGLEIEALKDLSPEEQYRQIAAAIAKIEDPTQRAAMAIQIFGESGTSLLPMMSNLDALIEKARKLGIILTDDQVKAAVAAQAAFEDLDFAWEGLKNQFASTILPNLKPLIEGLIEVIKWIGDAQRAWGEFTKSSQPGLPQLITSIAPWAPLVMGHAEGGIVTSPHIGMVGEAGPEAIIPLNKFQTGSYKYEINISAGAFMGNEADARAFARRIINIVRENNRLGTVGRLA